jgi:hypothetical protein
MIRLNTVHYEMLTESHKQPSPPAKSSLQAAIIPRRSGIPCALEIAAGTSCHACGALWKLCC